jgi:lysophospholipase L1-like esterase
VTLASSLVALEVGLRLFWSGFYVKQTGEHLQQSFTRSWENKPGYEGVLEEPEFKMRVKHNSLGLRGPEVAPTKAPGAVRIVAVGDSFTYGVGVHDEETFCARLAALDPRLEVINAGVNNYGTDQELLALKEQGLPLGPDVVLVCVFWNDLPNSYQRSETGFALRDGVLVHEPPPSLKVPRSMKRAGPMRFSRAYRFLSDRSRVLKRRLGIALGLREEVDPRVNDTSEPAWALHLALLDEIVRLTREAGAKPMVVVIPDQRTIYPDMDLLGVTREQLTIAPRLLAWGRAREVPVVDVTPAMREAAAAASAPLYYPIDFHLVAEGNEVVARAILEALRQAGWVPPPG